MSASMEIENGNISYAERLKQRKFARMRQGQSAAEIETLPSDPEMRVAIVPLTEIEYDNALAGAAKIKVEENAAGFARRDRQYTRLILMQALRDPNNFEVQIWTDVDEMMGTLDSTDVDYLIDCFNELTATSNPSIDGIPKAEFDFLVESLQKMNWNELSGRSWHAAKRFLGALMLDGQLRGSGLGFTSTKSLTTENE